METSEYYTMYRVEKEHWWYKGLRDLIFSYIKRNSPLHILDAGCGTGITMQSLTNKGYKLNGFDLSSLAVSFTKKRGLKNVKQGSILQIPYPGKSFDVVLNTDVLGSLNRKQVNNAVEEFYRVLKPGGTLILQVAALEQLRSPHDIVTHLKVRYAKNELQKLFLYGKWTIVKISYRMFFLFPVIFLVKILKKITVRNETGATTDLWLPPPFLNFLLFSIVKIENVMFHYINFPIGSSLFLVARKKQ